MRSANTYSGCTFPPGFGLRQSSAAFPPTAPPPNRFWSSIEAGYEQHHEMVLDKSRHRCGCWIGGRFDYLPRHRGQIECRLVCLCGSASCVSVRSSGRRRHPGTQSGVCTYLEKTCLAYQSISTHRATSVFSSRRFFLHSMRCRGHSDASFPRHIRSATGRIIAVHWYWNLVWCSVMYESISKENGSRLTSRRGQPPLAPSVPLSRAVSPARRG
jgi:hypothetical protein